MVTITTEVLNNLSFAINAYLCIISCINNRRGEKHEKAAATGIK